MYKITSQSYMVNIRAQKLSESPYRLTVLTVPKDKEIDDE